jgi:uracil-DNA glycosylase family 4
VAHAAQAGRLEVEAPGREEDESGRPFVGAAGRFPDHVLEGADDARADLLITNIVKCRPPKNRAPRVGEAETRVQLPLRTDRSACRRSCRYDGLET